MKTLVETHISNQVATLSLNKPDKHNALCDEMLRQLMTALENIQHNADVKVVLLCGNGKSFAAGVDISTMVDTSYIEAYTSPLIDAVWSCVSNCTIPVIAAVHGYVLGGGLELALQCDFIYADETAKLGLPEIKLGIIPGIGGTQRLPRAVGLPQAALMTLTGEPINAHDALRLGLVQHVAPAGTVVEAALQTAKLMAAHPRPILMKAKEALRASQELPLTQGLQYEKRLFHATFAMPFQREGMQAFLEKRPPNYR